MRISILCSDAEHPVNTYLQLWVARNNFEHQVELVRKKSELSGGDILFLISCGEIVSARDRKAYTSSLVLHASDLPRGRGWSPHIWELLAGADGIVMSLLEAEDKVDSGRIWSKRWVPIPKTALWHEINDLVFSAEMELMDFALTSFGNICPQQQPIDVEATYFRLRTWQDSQVDPNKSIIEQFDQIRVCDPNRFPAFFELRGQRYALKLEKYDNE
ncbi:UDP-glucuronic acid dehydrogenase [Chromobacterium haemolyticum]|uniref:UDP-glucuronic acid dehydrogenase n=1 Tax=Chromobacterium fluminis TaxID=3044269 RepID=A0ABX0L527_9NEIS|nr:UDP-glucuronic acid dehydrogenase [Chromobacterium haemolyticum]NHR06924.1 UDP-glucuronic acid dehydrogenase [Chromobacterium haemolyticum]